MAEAKQIVVFPRGQLSDKDRRMIAKAGVCVVEADDPSKVVSVLPVGSLVSADDLTMAALEAVGADGSYSKDVLAAFFKGLYHRVKARAEKST